MRKNQMSIFDGREERGKRLPERLGELWERLRYKVSLRLVSLRREYDGWALADNRGISTVEVILIIVVLVGLVIVFRDQITKIVNSLFSKITTNVDKI